MNKLITIRLGRPERDKSRLTFLKNNGINYGYPQCCINEFLGFQKAISSNKILIARTHRKLHGTGYVPCIKCNRKSSHLLIKIINSNRDNNLPKFSWIT